MNKGIKIACMMLALLLIQGILLATAPKTESKEYFFGHGSLYMGDEWMKVTDKAIHFYAQDNGWKIITQNGDLSAEQQIKQIRYFVEQGVDGFIWSPTE